jgi:hypothetical protein
MNKHNERLSSWFILIRTIIGFIARLVFWISAIYLVISSCVLSWMSYDYLMAVLKLIFFPLTWIISPWFDGQWKILLLSWGAYLISTIVGGLSPVDR